jgi:hypothetical protein
VRSTLKKEDEAETFVEAELLSFLYNNLCLKKTPMAKLKPHIPLSLQLAHLSFS